jgi:hypothetical protein
VSLHEAKGFLANTYDRSLRHERLLRQLRCLALLHDSLHDKGAGVSTITTSFHLKWHRGCRLTAFDFISLLLTLALSL